MSQCNTLHCTQWHLPGNVSNKSVILIHKLKNDKQSMLIWAMLKGAVWGGGEKQGFLWPDSRWWVKTITIVNRMEYFFSRATRNYGLHSECILCGSPLYLAPFLAISTYISYEIFIKESQIFSWSIPLWRGRIEIRPCGWKSTNFIDVCLNFRVRKVNNLKESSLHSWFKWSFIGPCYEMYSTITDWPSKRAANHPQLQKASFKVKWGSTFTKTTFSLKRDLVQLQIVLKH